MSKQKPKIQSWVILNFEIIISAWRGGHFFNYMCTALIISVFTKVSKSFHHSQTLFSIFLAHCNKDWACCRRKANFKHVNSHNEQVPTAFFVLIYSSSKKIDITKWNSSFIMIRFFNGKPKTRMLRFPHILVTLLSSGSQVSKSSMLKMSVKVVKNVIIANT